jgi:hypothetical protein
VRVRAGMAADPFYLELHHLSHKVEGRQSEQRIDTGEWTTRLHVKAHMTPMSESADQRAEPGLRDIRIAALLVPGDRRRRSRSAYHWVAVCRCGVADRSRSLRCSAANCHINSGWIVIMIPALPVQKQACDEIQSAVIRQQQCGSDSGPLSFPGSPQLPRLR